MSEEIKASLPSCRTCDYWSEQGEGFGICGNAANRELLRVLGGYMACHAAYGCVMHKPKVQGDAAKREMGMSGETLAVLHHTHGYDPETVAGVVNMPPPQILTDYYQAMETEKERSRAAIVRTVISGVSFSNDQNQRPTTKKSQ